MQLTLPDLDFWALSPVLAMTLTGCLVLIVDLFAPPRRSQTLLAIVALLGLAVTAVFSVLLWDYDGTVELRRDVHRGQLLPVLQRPLRADRGRHRAPLPRAAGPGGLPPRGVLHPAPLLRGGDDADGLGGGPDHGLPGPGAALHPALHPGRVLPPAPGVRGGVDQVPPPGGLRLRLPAVRDRPGVRRRRGRPTWAASPSPWGRAAPWPPPPAPRRRPRWGTARR